MKRKGFLCKCHTECTLNVILVHSSKTSREHFVDLASLEYCSHQTQKTYSFEIRGIWVGGEAI